MIFDLENECNPVNTDNMNVIKVVQNSGSKDEESYIYILTWLLGNRMIHKLINWNVIILPQSSPHYLVYHVNRRSWEYLTRFLGQ